MAQKSRTELKTFYETDDVPTQDQYGDLLDSVGIFKRNVATYSQGGGADPVIVVLENTFSAPIAFVRIGAGAYRGTLIGAFPLGKVAFFSSGSSNFADTVISIDRTSDDTIIINTSNGTSFVDGILNATAIEIRTYF